MLKQSELKKLKRADLLELLIAQSKENKQLRTRIEEMKEQLEDRKISIERSGSLAEAALQLNGVFRDADAAAQQYIDNIRQRSMEQEEICRRMLEEAQQKADQIISAAETHKAKCLKEAERYRIQVPENGRTLRGQTLCAPGDFEYEKE